MAAGSPGVSDVRYIPGLTAGASFASGQYKVVKFASTANAVIAVAATTDVAIGVIQNDAASGEAALVAYDGIVLCLAGAADLAAGENVGYNTTGQVVDHVTATRMSIGRTLDASTAVGDYVRVMLYGGGAHDGIGA